MQKFCGGLARQILAAPPFGKGGGCEALSFFQELMEHAKAHGAKKSTWPSKVQAHGHNISFQKIKIDHNTTNWKRERSIKTMLGEIINFLSEQTSEASLQKQKQDIKCEKEKK